MGQNDEVTVGKGIFNQKTMNTDLQISFIRKYDLQYRNTKKEDIKGEWKCKESPSLKTYKQKIYLQSFI